MEEEQATSPELPTNSASKAFNGILENFQGIRKAWLESGSLWQNGDNIRDACPSGNLTGVTYADSTGNLSRISRQAP
jgi:hypothetical protein